MGVTSAPFCEISLTSLDLRGCRQIPESNRASVACCVDDCSLLGLAFAVAFFEVKLHETDGFDRLEYGSGPLECAALEIPDVDHLVSPSAYQ